MITFKNAGYNGRLGNTLFPYATLFGVANKLGVDFGVPYENGNAPTKYGYFDFFTNEWIHYQFNLPKVFNLTAKNISYYDYKPEFLYYEKFFQFDKDIFNIKNGTDINGWFQSYKYFEHCEKELRTELSFNDFYTGKAMKHWADFGLANSFVQNKKLLMISMRLDDGYGLDANFATTTINYYKNALQLFDLNEYEIIITSDNPDKCVQALENIIGQRKIHVLREPCPYTTMAFYTLCDGFIISNSTFGWWGAWLSDSENKKVVMPKNWFNADVCTDDIAPISWIKL